MQSRFFKSKNGYVTFHYETPNYGWTNWHNKNGKFIASLERVSDVPSWFEWVKTQDLTEMTEEEFNKIKHE